MSILDDPAVRTLLRQAWDDSQPGTPACHEEGGFVLRNADGSHVIERWPGGALDRIVVPPHAGGKRNGLAIVATFHTHPNAEPEFDQRPSLTDIRAVTADPNLRQPEYEGEYVISRETVYRIRKDGRVEELGDSSATLGL